MTLDRSHIHRFFLVVAIFFITAYSIFYSFTTYYQLYALVFFLLILGLPHGALDFEIAKAYKLIKGPADTIFFLLSYLLISAACIYLWFLNPSMTLLFFLGVSIMHFSNDWREISPTSVATSLSTMLICLPAIASKAEVKEYFSYLFLQPHEASFITFIMASGFFLALLIFLISSILHGVKNRFVLIEFCLLTLMAFTLPVLIYFMVYFCFLHSMNHIGKLSATLKKRPSELWIKSIPIIALVIFLSLPFITQGQHISLESILIQWIFIGLFALTIPHMILIDVLLKKLTILKP